MRGVRFGPLTTESRLAANSQNLPRSLETAELFVPQACQDIAAWPARML